MVINCLSPPSTNNFLKILISFLDTEQLMEATENCLKLLRTIWGFDNFSGLPTAFWNFQELSDTSKNYFKVPKSFDTSKNFLRLWRTAKEVWELSEVCENCLKLPGTFRDFHELFDTSSKYLTWSELFKSSENYLRYPRMLHKNTGRRIEMVEENSGPSGPS